MIEVLEGELSPHEVGQPTIESHPEEPPHLGLGRLESNVGETRSLESVLKQLLQITSRHTQDLREGLNFQLEDGLELLANYWDMSAAVIGQIHEATLTVTHTIVRSDKWIGEYPFHVNGSSQLPDPNTWQQLFAETVITASFPIGTTAALEIPHEHVIRRAQTYFGSPLFVDEQCWGTLFFVSQEPRSHPFTEGDKELLSLFANWIGSVIERLSIRSLRATEQSDLARVNREIARSNSDLDQFVYIASHDLKEPLRGISQYAQFLTEDYYDQLDNDGRRMLNALIAQSQRMVKQIDDLRFYSRIGRYESGIELVDLNEIIGDVRARLHTLLDETGAGIRIPRPLPTIKGNAALITTVFQNLIANAAHYNDKPHKWIQIGWSYKNLEETVEKPSDYGRGQIILMVSDNGIGIHQRDQEAVFNMFRRLHGQDKFGGGTGAGLAIVKRILEQENGRIWIESEVGVGTQFYFTFG